MQHHGGGGRRQQRGVPVSQWSLTPHTVSESGQLQLVSEPPGCALATARDLFVGELQSTPVHSSPAGVAIFSLIGSA